MKSYLPLHELTLTDTVQVDGSFSAATEANLLGVMTLAGASMSLRQTLMTANRSQNGQKANGKRHLL